MFGTKSARRGAPRALALACPLVFATLLLAGAPPAGAAGGATDWKPLQQSVLGLQVYAPGQSSPVEGVGFFVEGVDGLITSHRLIKGASRVVVHGGGASPVEVARYLGRDAKADIVILDVPAPAKKLIRGSYQMMSPNQFAFAILPAAATATIPPMHMAGFQASGLGDILAIDQTPPLGTPLADSLGRAIGLIEPLGDGKTAVTCAVPIERVLAVVAQPDAGGPLSALASDPTPPWTSAATPEGMQVLGGWFTRARKFPDAVTWLTRATDANPKLAEAWMEWGMALQSQDQNPDAEKKYRKALELQPSNAKAHLYLGSCLFNQEMLLQAQAEYDAALKADPQLAQVYVNLAGVFFRQEKKDDAEKAFRRALEMQPNLGIAHYNLGVLFASQGRTAAALNELDVLRKERSGFATQLQRFMGAK
jgi:hypothetical protein